MTSFLAPHALLTWLVLPALAAFAMVAMRLAAERFGGAALDDRTEKTAIGAMLLPFALGLTLVPLAPGLPDILPQTVTPMVLEPHAETHAGEVSTAIRLQIDRDTVLAVLAIAYGAVALWRLGVVGAGLRSLRRIAVQAESSPLGGDVAVTRDLPMPVVAEDGKILLPEDLARSLSADELMLIIAHERAHHARGDQRYFIILALIDAVFWLHPAIRWQTARCRLAAELACDRAACEAQPKMRKAYAELIVRALQHAAGGALPCAPAVFSPRTKGEFGMRLTEIMRPRAKAGKRGMGLALAALMAVPLALGQFAVAQQGATAFTVAPVERGKVTSPFGMRMHPVEKKRMRHWGTDIGAPIGTPVRAPGPGVVSRAENVEAYGNILEITHPGGIVTRYSQLDNFEAEVGDRVPAGALVARVGSSGRSTGPHLHIEVFVDGSRVDPETMIKMPTER